MTGWSLHWLEAEGELAPWRARLEAEFAAAHAAIARVVPPPVLDIVVQRTPGFAIPELGMGAHAYRRRCFGLSLDPDNPQFERALADGAARRLIVHEAHHCMRMASQGYGRTLGEALVSEGLAGRFTGAVLGTPPEPWEQAVDGATLATHWPDAAALALPEYDHSAWFFGTGGRLPRWLGYTMGYELAGRWVAAAAPDGPGWIDAAADAVLAVSAPSPPPGP